MPLTSAEAFKVGFLARCTEAGLTPEQTLHAVKQAGDMLKTAIVGDLLGKVLDVGKGVAGGVASYGLPLAAVAPPILGGLAGYGLAKARDIDDTDVDAVKQQEIVEELRRQAATLKRKKAVRDFRAASAPRVRPLF